jgi:hypothetical protein
VIARLYYPGGLQDRSADTGAASLPVLKGGTERLIDFLSFLGVSFFILTKVTGVINNNYSDYRIIWIFSACIVYFKCGN